MRQPSYCDSVLFLLTETAFVKLEHYQREIEHQATNDKEESVEKFNLRIVYYWPNHEVNGHEDEYYGNENKDLRKEKKIHVPE